MKLLVIGPTQSTQSPEALARRALQESQVENYQVLTPYAGENKWTAMRRMVRESKMLQFDTVSAQDPFLVGLIAWYIARKSGARFNVQVHADLAAQPWWRHILAQIILRHADSIRVVSEKVKQQVEPMGVRARVGVLPLYVDVARFRALERRPERMVLWVGRFEKEKDPFYALEVIRRIPDTKLVMLGSGSLESALKAKSKALLVEFPGWQDPLPYLRSAGVLLNTSPAESFGVSMVEALAVGVPVVAPDVGVAKEAGGIVVPKAQLASAVERVLASKEGGVLRLQLPTEQEWVERWKQTL